MRTLIDIPDPQAAALAKIGQREGRSRAALIREAIAGLILAKRRDETDEAFGLWREHKEDGLAYQERVRGEW
jgi:hypothetical protein